jgi:hypothetical protein
MRLTFVFSWFRVFVASVLALGACRVSMSPVQNRLAPGEEPFAVFVAAGEAGLGDLFAVRADGGTTFPITYTRVRELAPALSPAGTDIAFIREGVRDDPSSRRVVVMNLLNGAERVIPAADAPPEAVAWSDDATLLYIRVGSATLVAAAPPADPAPRALQSLEAVHADSAFAVLVGTPAFASVSDCPDGGVCVVQRGGERTLFSADGTGPVRWGSDSVGYFVGSAFFIRPLGPGRMRELRLTPPRLDPQQMTFFPGPAGQGPQ